MLIVPVVEEILEKRLIVREEVRIRRKRERKPEVMEPEGVPESRE